MYALFTVQQSMRPNRASMRHANVSVSVDRAESQNAEEFVRASEADLHYVVCHAARGPRPARLSMKVQVLKVMCYPTSSYCLIWVLFYLDNSCV